MSIEKIESVEDLEKVYEDISDKITNIDFDNKYKLTEDIKDLLNPLLESFGVEISSEWSKYSVFENNMIVEHDLLKVNLELKKELKIISDIIKLKKLALSLEIEDPGLRELKISNFWIIGEVEFGENVNLKICANIKDLEFFGSLKINGELDFKDFYKNILKIENENLLPEGSYKLSKGEIYVNPRASRYSLDVGVEGEMEIIGDNLKLGNLDLNLRYIQGNIYGKFRGELKIGKKEEGKEGLIVVVEAEKHEEGWSLEGKTQGELNLTDLIKDICEGKDPSSYGLPNDLKIKSLRTKIDKRENSTNFDFELDVEGHWDLKIIEITKMYLSVSKTGKNIAYRVLGEADMGGAKVFVDFSSSGDKKWSLSGGTREEFLLNDFYNNMTNKIGLPNVDFPESIKQTKVKSLNASCIIDKSKEENSSISEYDFGLSIENLLKFDIGSKTFEVKNIEIGISKEQTKLYGRLKMGDVDFSLSADHNNNEGWEFKGQLEEKVTLGKIIESVGLTPPEIVDDALKTIELKKAEITYNTKKKSYSLELNLGSVENPNIPPMKIGDAEFKIEDFTLTVENPGKQNEEDDPKTEFKVSCKIRLGEIVVGMKLEKDGDGWEFKGGLVEEVSLKGIITSIGSPTLPEVIGKNLNTIKIKKTEIEYNSKKGTYKLELEIKSLQEVDVDPIKIGGVKFEIEDFTLLIEKKEKQNGEDDPKTEYNVGCKLKIGGIDISIKLRKDGDDWEFTGLTENTENKTLKDLFGQNVPEVISDVEINKIGINYKSSKQSGTNGEKLSTGGFEIETTIPIFSEKLKLQIDYKNETITKNGNQSTQAKFSGKLEIKGHKLDVEFNKADETNSIKNNYLTAVYEKDGGLDIKELICSISEQLKNVIPEEGIFKLEKVWFIYQKIKKNGRDLKPWWLLGGNLNLELPLNKIPLIGEKIKEGGNKISMSQIFISSQGYKAKENEPDEDNLLKILKNNLGERIKLPEEINNGLNIIGEIKLPKFEKEINIGGSSEEEDQTNTNPAGDSTKTDVTPSGNTNIPKEEESNIKWLKISKGIGPIFIDGIGLELKDKDLVFYLKASLSISGVKLTLENLKLSVSLESLVKMDLSNLNLRIGLKGIGVSFESASLTISGVLLHQGEDEYSGAILIQTKMFTISAIGSYKKLEGGQPSIFAYACLKKGLGGTAAFYVNGLAFGFGINRELKIPDIKGVKEFPLVKMAVEDNVDLMGMLTDLDKHISPKLGSIFVSFGIKFSSFNFIDSFILLNVQVGEYLKISILGFSRLEFPSKNERPSGVNPIALIELAIICLLDFEEGIFKIQGELTDSSYILHKDCKLRGGFAFCTWFKGENSGDFVLSFGGYHPNFDKPSHYPSVPRIEFIWDIPPVKINGGLYLAITPSMLMFGGYLKVTYSIEIIEAWYSMSVDFLICWDPFFYEARLKACIGAAFNLLLVKIKVEVGAELEIWGPDFSGVATIDVEIGKFDIEFGGTPRKSVRALTWEGFEKKFLKEKEEVCAISITGGLNRIEEREGNHNEKVWIIDSNSCEIIVESIIPSSEISATGKIDDKSDDEIGEFGIAPMGKSREDVEVKTEIKVKKEGEELGKERIESELIKKNMPLALWGEKIAPRNSNDGLVRNVFTGCKITSLADIRQSKTKEKPLSKFETENIHLNLEYDQTQKIKFDEETIGESIGEVLKDYIQKTQNNNLKMRTMEIGGM